MRSGRALVVALTGVLVMAYGVYAQGQPYRRAVDLVSIYATATDRDGRLVPDLTKDDFEVRDDGRQQPLTVFSNDLQPIICVVMLDRSFSMADNEDIARDGAAQFVKAMLPADRVRIGSFAEEIHLSPETFTGDQPALMNVLKNELQAPGPSPVWTAVDRSITALRQESGRRVVLLFSDGHDQPVRGQVFTDVKDVMRRARLNDIMVYAIGFPSDASPSMPFAARGGYQLFGSSKQKQKPPSRELQALAEESGGGYFEVNPYQSIGRTFARIADELHRQYWLGFTPRALDGRTHELEVKVKRRGVTVRARTTYVAQTVSAPGQPSAQSRGTRRR